MRTYQKEVIILSLLSVFRCGNRSDKLPNVCSWSRGILLRHYDDLRRSVDMVGNWLGIHIFINSATVQVRARLPSSLKKQKKKEKNRERERPRKAEYRFFSPPRWARQIDCIISGCWQSLQCNAIKQNTAIGAAGSLCIIGGWLMFIILRRTYTMTYCSVRASPPIAIEMTAEGGRFVKNLTNTGVLPVHNSLKVTKSSTFQWAIF